MYMVGTACRIVTRSRSSTSSAFPASKRGMSVRLAPAATAEFSPQVCPKEWNKGSPPKMTSSGWGSNSATQAATLLMRLAWVSSAPFGLPVVPEV